SPFGYDGGSRRIGSPHCYTRAPVNDTERFTAWRKPDLARIRLQRDLGEQLTIAHAPDADGAIVVCHGEMVAGRVYRDQRRRPGNSELCQDFALYERPQFEAGVDVAAMLHQYVMAVTAQHDVGRCCTDVDRGVPASVRGPPQVNGILRGSYQELIIVAQAEYLLVRRNRDSPLRLCVAQVPEPRAVALRST